MPKPGFIARHRNLLLIVLLASTLALSSNAARQRLESARPTTALPVTQAASPVAAYTAQRDTSFLTDLQALHSLCENASLDAATREAAADRLTRLIADRDAEAALEEALSRTALAPCAAVISGGSVTIVTEKAALTPEEAALALTLAVAHTGLPAASVRILPAQ